MALFSKQRESSTPTKVHVDRKGVGVSRSYIFALSARTGGIGNGTDAQFVVRFRYPADEAAAAQAAQIRELQAQALMVEAGGVRLALDAAAAQDRKSTRLNYSQ